MYLRDEKRFREFFITLRKHITNKGWTKLADLEAYDPFWSNIRKILSPKETE